MTINESGRIRAENAVERLALVPTLIDTIDDWDGTLKFLANDDAGYKRLEATVDSIRAALIALDPALRKLRETRVRQSLSKHQKRR